MVANDVDPGTISDINPSNGAFNTAPNQQKIFHPYGGGVNYMSSVGTVASNIAS